MIKQINWVDILAVIILFRTCYIGVNKGFWVETFKFLGTTLGAILSLYYYENLTQFLKYHILIPQTILKIFCLIGIFLGVVFIFKLIRLILQTLMKVEVLAGLERLGGAIIGLARGAITISIILITLAILPSEYTIRSIKERSFLGPHLLKIVPAIYSLALKLYPSLVNKGEVPHF